MPGQLKKYTDFQISYVHSVLNDTESIKFFESKIWKILPSEVKQLESLKEFKKAIKQWKQSSCQWRLFKTHLHRLGFIWNRFTHISF